MAASGWLRRTLALERGEAVLTALVSCYLLLIIASYLILKATRDALYLDAFGAVKLPYVIIGIAVLVGLFVDGYIRLARRFATPALTMATLLFFIVNLLVFWVLAREGESWLYPVIYVWTGCYGVIAPVQVWTLVNELFTTRQTKRLVGTIGAAGIAGAVGGGMLTSSLAEALGAENLLLVVVLMLAASVAIVAALGRHRRRPGRAELRTVQPSSLRQAVRTIAGSHHLTTVAGLVWLSALCTTIVDYQFKAAAAGAGFERDDLAAFFGAAYGAMALASLSVQVVLVRFLLQRFGLGAVVLLLPVSLMTGTLFLIGAGSLVAATLLKSGDGAFKHSVDRSAKELAYLPVAGRIKVQVKSAIDMVLDRFGDGTAGVLLLGLGTWLGWGFQGIGLVNLALLCGWLVLAVRLKRSYRAELARSLGDRQAAAALADLPLADADTRQALIRALGSSDESEVLAALDLAALLPPDTLADELRRLAHEGSPVVRARVAGVLLQGSESDVPPELLDRLRDEDQKLLERALDLVLAEGDEELRARAAALIGEVAPETRGVMLALLVRRLGPEFEPMAGRVLDVLCAPSAPVAVRAAAASAVGLLPADSALAARLDALFDDAEPAVRALAAESAGRLGREDLAPRLVPELGHARTRRSARIALRRLGDGGTRALSAALLDPATPPGVRRRIPRLLGELASGDDLGAALASERSAVRNAALAALSWRKRSQPQAAMPAGVPAAARAGLEQQTRRTAELMALWDPCRAARGSEEALFLAEALRERLLADLDRLCQWLELGGSPALVGTVARGLRSGRRVERDNALELLEGTLTRERRADLLPLMERLGRLSEEEAAPAGRTRSRPEPNVLRRLVDLLDGEAPLLAACAVRLAAAAGLDDVLRAVPPATAKESDVLRQEIDRAHSAGRAPGSATMNATTLLDRAMALKSIELFRTVPAEDLVHLARVTREETHEAGELLFAEGDPPGPLYVVLTGRIELQRGGGPAGQVAAGSPLGTWSLFDDQPRRLGAVVVEPARVLAIERDDFYDVLAEHVEILRSLLGNLVQRIHSLTV